MPAPSLRTRLSRIALTAFVRGTATAAGAALVSLTTWWITHH
ncbi:hypothetical protein [Actinomadura hibisca]|nr:hypothetical protein [Actinomadura hibisca]